MIIVLLSTAIIVAHFDEMTKWKYQIYVLVFGMADLCLAGVGAFCVLNRIENVLTREVDLKTFLCETTEYLILMILPPCCFLVGTLIWK